MAHDDDAGRRQDRWARLRFAVVGALLAAPPKKGALQQALTALAAREWQHPIRHEPVRFGRSTLERWYYQARRARDPVGQLRRRLRADAGQQPAMGAAVRQALRTQYDAHRSWSYQLHVDNLRVLVQADPSLGPMPSYATVRRFMQAQGLVRQRRRTARDRPGADRIEVARQAREVRSYEVEYVGGLWHADFHHGSLKVLTAAGAWATPVLVAFLDLFCQFPVVAPYARQLGAIAGVTEHRSGTSIFNDRMMLACGAASLADCALTVYATVVSRAGPEAC
jgi:putative transposase